METTNKLSGKMKEIEIDQKANVIVKTDLESFNDYLNEKLIGTKIGNYIDITCAITKLIKEYVNMANINISAEKDSRYNFINVEYNYQTSNYKYYRSRFMYIEYKYSVTKNPNWNRWGEPYEIRVYKEIKVTFNDNEKTLEENIFQAKKECIKTLNESNRIKNEQITQTEKLFELLKKEYNTDNKGVRELLRIACNNQWNIKD